ncbi:MAG: hypothetical protein D3922_09980 [Candidatus Electrothrix sp. AR1]|nr:hypothetical protein [Candidatus Electrothrix sp. AR1]
MRRRPDRFNTKRKIQSRTDVKMGLYDSLVEKVQYGGNPEHKKNPGDFALTPPSAPRPSKSLCDAVQIFSRKVAVGYLRDGLKKGMMSCQMKGRWPQNIWAVTDAGEPLEAQLENSATGVYHGYPMPESDPFSHEVIKEWKARYEKI